MKRLSQKDMESRNRRIIADSKILTSKELCKKYGLTDFHIREIVNNCRADGIAADEYIEPDEIFKKEHKKQKPFTLKGVQNVITALLSKVIKERDFDFFEEYDGELAELYCALIDIDPLKVKREIRNAIAREKSQSVRG